METERTRGSLRRRDWSFRHSRPGDRCCHHDPRRSPDTRPRQRLDRLPPRRRFRCATGSAFHLDVVMSTGQMPGYHRRPNGIAPPQRQIRERCRAEGSSFLRLVAGCDRPTAWVAWRAFRAMRRVRSTRWRRPPSRRTKTMTQFILDGMAPVIGTPKVRQITAVPIPLSKRPAEHLPGGEEGVGKEVEGTVPPSHG